MCCRRLKIFLLLPVLFFLLSFSPLSSSCYAEVTLTDEEAQEILNEIKESKKDLTELQEKLTSAEAQLKDVQNAYSEQKTSYEMQLKEAEEKQKKLRKALTVTSTSSAVFCILMVVFIIL